MSSSESAIVAAEHQAATEDSRVALERLEQVQRGEAETISSVVLYRELDL